MGYSPLYAPPQKRHRGSKRIRQRASGFGSRILAGFGAFFSMLAAPFVAFVSLFRGKRTASFGLSAEPSTGPSSASRHAAAGGPSKASPVLFALLSLAVAASGLFLGWAFLYSDTGVTLTIDYCGDTRTVTTKAETVAELLEKHGIEVREADSINYSLTSALTDGMELVIQNAFPVTVASGGRVTILQMRDGCVSDALSLVGVQYDAVDELTQLPYADVEPGMHIQHIDINTTYETIDQTVEYSQEIVKDASRYIGDDKVKVTGEDGQRRIVRRIVYKDGVLTSREIMNQIILKEVVDEIVIKGTKFRAQTSFTGDDRAWKPKPTKEEIHKTMVVPEITAYTHTGNRTATGRTAKIGRVAVNPKIIPYGTKLYIPGYGYCTAQDTGAFRHEEGGEKNQIDIFLNTEKECRTWGRKRNITIYILK